MGARARAKRSAWALPEDQRICIWCDGRAPQCEFRTREHVVAEGLGGDRDYRLMGGLVCDACNRRVLQKIDEEMLLIGPLRSLRAQFGLAPRGKDIAQGISYNHGENEFTVDTTKLRNNNAVEFDPVRGEITMQVSGPSAQARGEHLTRGLHRIAYNVLAYHHGGEYVRRRYRFLRDLVLDLNAIRERAYVLDQRPILRAMQAEATSRTRKRWFSTAEIKNGTDGDPEIVKVSIGPAIFYASVRRSTAPLAAIAASTENAIVYSIIETSQE
jgi:hypothetical protein